MIDVFKEQDVKLLIQRIEKLKENQLPLWGNMNTAQMLAHCNVTYLYTYEPYRFEKPNFLKSFLLKAFVKKYVVSDAPYKNNSRTAPDFIISDSRDFETEKQTLIANIEKTQRLGEEYFDGLKNFSFGEMTKKEWNTMFSKHLDHHLRQFGV